MPKLADEIRSGCVFEDIITMDDLGTAFLDCDPGSGAGPQGRQFQQDLPEYVHPYGPEHPGRSGDTSVLRGEAQQRIVGSSGIWRKNELIILKGEGRYWPNIFKRFLQPNASDFNVSDAGGLWRKAGGYRGRAKRTGISSRHRGKDTQRGRLCTDSGGEDSKDARQQAEDWPTDGRSKEADRCASRPSLRATGRICQKGLRQAGQARRSLAGQRAELQALEKATAARSCCGVLGRAGRLSLAIAEKVIHVSPNNALVRWRMISVLAQRRGWVHLQQAAVPPRRCLPLRRS